MAQKSIEHIAKVATKLVFYTNRVNLFANFVLIMKLPKTDIKVTTNPESVRYDDFAIEARRNRSQIDLAVARGQLNWGEALGMKMVVIDALSNAYVEKCRAADKFGRELKRSKATGS